MWRIISFSYVNLPLKPFLPGYFLVIVEDNSNNRLIARADKKHNQAIEINGKGTIEKKLGPTGVINLFIPNKALSLKADNKMEIKKIGIIGTGTMGRQLSYLFASLGYDVVLKSRHRESVEKSLKTIKNDYFKNLELKEAQEVLCCIKPSLKWEDLQDRDLIIECTLEKMEVKKKLLKKLEQITFKKTILASSTSSISIEKLALSLSFPSRFLGIHFFNPVGRMRLVEIVKSKKTSQEVIEDVSNFITRIEKIGLVINDNPGFIVNRLLFSMINEAGYLLSRKVGIEDVDIAMKIGASHPMGPFELADFIGIDITYNILRNLRSTIPGFRQPAKIFKKMITEGKLGRKTKKGFYTY